MTRFIRQLFGGLSVLLVLICFGCLRDLSGITMDRDGHIYSINNRPGVFARCEADGDSLRCKPLPYRLNTYRSYDFEGITWVTDSMFYTVIEKTDNQCSTDCNLSQQVLAFQIDPKGYVISAACDPLEIPLFKNDNPDCRFANCGLEGVAYDSRHNRLYIAKEHSQARLFVAELDERHCPTGNVLQMKPPKTYASYSDLAYSAKRHSLFVLSSRQEGFFEWDLKENRIILNSDEAYPDVRPFIQAHIPTEGIYIDDRNDSILLLAEDGALYTAKLPEKP